MGCVSSKIVKADLFIGDDFPNHIVSLTSTTYGVLELDPKKPLKDSNQSLPPSSTNLPPSSQTGVLEVINAWELMEDLDDDIHVFPTNTQVFASDEYNFLNQVKSPTKKKTRKKLVGKENLDGFEQGQGRVLPRKPFASLDNLQTPMPMKGTRNETLLFMTARSFSPLFNPKLLASMRRGLSKEGEQHLMKMISISPGPKNQRPGAAPYLESSQKRCPTVGENAVVIYITTLRGIRKTFEDCNRVRAAIEAYDVLLIEKDVSMDSGFREELKVLLGEGKMVQVPVVFVKGGLIGGVDEVLKLEEEGKLKMLFEGIPRAMGVCGACGNARFLVCVDCNGSCKVWDQGKEMARCSSCNENGLIRCPICY